jgi:16S rRNA (guanine527-N7)-methyltransferase
VTPDSFTPIIRARLAHAGVHAADEVVSRNAAYLALLAKWNARMNLTAFDLANPSDAAIDRLIVEPVQAAAAVRPDDRVMIDIGSGGGSPAFPFLLASPHELRAVLIEARTRRSGFLREAARVLDLPKTRVETARFSREWCNTRLEAPTDIVTLRAVRPDADLWGAVASATRVGSRVIWFAALGQGVRIWSYDIFELAHSTDKFVVLQRVS